MIETRQVKYVSPMIKASVTTDVGCVREANEDNGRHIVPNDSEIQSKRGTLTIVADGMGGHSSGEVASQMAVELIAAYYYADEINDAPEALRNAIELANQEIYETAISDEQYFGMGTTIVALVLLGDYGYTAHVGDSRVYRLRVGEMAQMTMDHSQVVEMFKQGLISWEETKHHEDKNVILRAVGTQPKVEADISDAFRLEPNDEFLLCSDGLNDMVEDDEISRIWLQAKNVFEASENLVQRAKDYGGHDNVTVAVVRVPTEDDGFIGRVTPITREIGV